MSVLFFYRNKIGTETAGWLCSKDLFALFSGPAGKNKNSPSTFADRAVFPIKASNVKSIR